jgi:hypothetical protein
MQLLGYVDRVTRSWLRITPSETSAIVRTDLRDFREFGLNLLPTDPSLSEATFENHRRNSRACAIQMSVVTLDVLTTDASGVTQAETPSSFIAPEQRQPSPFISKL